MKIRFVGVFIVLSMLVNSAYADSANDGFIQYIPKSQQSKAEREINTKSDYIEFESLMNRLIRSGDVSKTIVLAALYEQDIKLKNGSVIRADKQKAKKMYEQAANNGIGLGFLKLGMFALADRNIDDALKYFEKATYSKHKDVSPTAALAYAVTVLDFTPSDIRRLLKASELLYPYSNQINLPTCSFVMAHIQLKLKNSNEANKYLSIACNNKMAPVEIKNYCFGDSVDVLNKGKPLEKAYCPTCNIK